MRISYNATSARVGGGLSYAVAQIAALREVESESRITVYASPGNLARLSQIEGVNIVPTRVSAPWLRYLWEQAFLPLQSRESDVLISPGNFGVLFCRTRQVVILQNPNYVGVGRRLATATNLLYRLKVVLAWQGMRRADQVVVISESLAREVASERALSSLRFVVVPSGAPAEFGDLSRTPIGLVETPFVVSVANDYPHKRLADVVLAFSRVSAPGKLVLVGEVTRRRQRVLEALAANRSRDVVFLGAVPDRDVVGSLFASARLAVAASELEAFPLTPHEAGSVGCPLLLSDIPPHREVAGDHGAYFQVGDLDALRYAMETALDSPRQRVPWTWNVSWHQHAARLANAIRSVAGVDNTTRSFS